MKLLTAVVAGAMAGALALAAQVPAAPPSPAEAREMADALPPDVKIDHFAVTADGQRTYLVNAAGEAWMHDHARKTSARIAVGPLWDLNLSPDATALAYTKGGDHRIDQYVWVVSLDPATGLAAGAERQLSPHQGDVPSISPDGRLVAFARDDSNGVGQSAVVIPIGGGTERVVGASLPSSVANIRWTPDGRTLYVGVNPPVACVPEWSCLPLAKELRQPPGSIQRATVSGGPMTVVATARGLSPGLSPDGTTLLYLDADSARRWVVADANGARRAAIVLPPTQTPAGWLRGSTALVASGGTVRRLRTMSLADGKSQTLADVADSLMDPSWSPDGTLVTVLARGTPSLELRLLNTDGSLRRAVLLPENFATATSWSPDQRWLAYAGFAENTPPHIAVVELETGRSQRLNEFGDRLSVSFRWLADSRGLVVSETVNVAENDRHVTFRKVDLSGNATVLREVFLGPAPSSGVAIDDATAVLMDNRAGHRIVRLHGDSSERTVLSARSEDEPLPSLSQDGQWLTLRHNPAPADGRQANAIELARVDGSFQKTIAIPFAPGSNPRLIPGAREFVVSEARRPDTDPGVFLVSANTESQRRLFTYSSQSGPPELAVSPDGRTLLYLASESIRQSVRTLDLSASRGR